MYNKFLEKYLDYMTNMYWHLMQKYSEYSRYELEKEKDLKRTWEELVEQLRSTCDIEKCGYILDLDGEKRIGKANRVHKS